MEAEKTRAGASEEVYLRGPAAGSVSALDTTVAVVIPAFDAAEQIRSSLPAVLDSVPLVVDAGSGDQTAAVAESLGARVLRMPERAGPAEARNVGAAAVEADVVLFVDADCVAAEGVVERVRRAFADDPELVTLTGSYDDDPADRGFFSLYMNLRHHHTHQGARREGSTFWAGCGAVRLDVFRRVGGFDADRYPRPMIEDIELGMRMKAHGKTRLDPRLQVKHLKRWTLSGVVTTDIWCRAVPWTELIAEGGGIPDDLNTRLSQRCAAALSPLVLLSVVMLPVLVVWRPSWAIVPLAIVAMGWMLSARLAHFFWRRRGPWFGVAGWLFHQVHLLYSAATFALVTLRLKLFGGRADPAQRRAAKL